VDLVPVWEVGDSTAREVSLDVVPAAEVGVATCHGVLVQCRVHVATDHLLAYFVPQGQRHVSCDEQVDWEEEDESHIDDDDPGLDFIEDGPGSEESAEGRGEDDQTSHDVEAVGVEVSIGEESEVTALRAAQDEAMDDGDGADYGEDDVEKDHKEGSSALREKFLQDHDWELESVTVAWLHK